MILAVKPAQKCQQVTWVNATWEDYEAIRDDQSSDRCKLFFKNNQLWVEMGAEGINHSKFSDLFSFILYILAARFPDIKLSILAAVKWKKEGLGRLRPTSWSMLARIFPFGKLDNRVLSILTSGDRLISLVRFQTRPWRLI
jgi:hypothetical protein